VQNYAHSANVWLEFTQRPEFLSGLEKLIADNASSNDARAASVGIGGNSGGSKRNKNYTTPQSQQVGKNVGPMVQR
jgi:hypothetical protein